jgi:hypothetical protein
MAPPAKRKKKDLGTAIAKNNRTAIARVRSGIINAGILEDAIVMAQTGHRRVRKPNGEEVFEELSAHDHIDIYKLMVNKVLPNIKDSVESDPNEQDWSKVLEEHKKG